MRTSMPVKCLCTFVAAVFVAGSPYTARAQHGDVWMHAVNNKIATGFVDEAATTYTPGVSALEVILTPDALPFSSFDYSAEDPGFRSAAGDLPGSQPVGLTIESLTRWNGSGFMPFSGASFSIDLSGGFETEPNGGMHEHPLYGLTDLTSSGIPDGVYVVTFHASIAGLADSDPYRLVMLRDDLIGDEDDAENLEGLLEDDKAGGAAPVFAGKDFTFFEQAYAAAIPEPASSAAALIAALGLMTAGRRRS